MEKPQLIPGMPRLQRGRRSVQVGIAPGQAVRLEVAPDTGPPPSRILGLLDGSRTAEAIQRDAAELGFAQNHVSALLSALRTRRLLYAAGSLLPRRLRPGVRRRLEAEAAALALRALPGDATPAQIIQARQRRRVVVDGHSRLTGQVASLLAAAGVGHVHPTATGVAGLADASVGGLLSTDARRPLRRALCDAVLRAAPETNTRVVQNHQADLLVLIGRPRPAPPTMLGPVLRKVPHLAVWVRDGTVVIGPLVRPGQTTCLSCVDLHRTDRDPRWPVLAAQLSTMSHPGELAEIALMSMAASMVAIEALRQLDGDDPDTLHATLEVSAPSKIHRRTWNPHPDCDCRSPIPWWLP